MTGWTWIRKGALAFCFLAALGLAGCTRDKPLSTDEPWALPTLPSVDVENPTPTDGSGAGGEATPATSPPTGEPVATTPPQQAPAEYTGPVTTYTVQDNDNLFRIAQRFNTDVDTLKRLNGLSNDIIYAGQVLRVPGEGTVQVSAPLTYRVQDGDTLLSIAQRYGTTVEELIRLNNLTNPDTIIVGQVLQVAAEGGQTQQPDTGAQSTDERTYTVQPGDTLGSIAVQFGVTIQALIEANNIANPDNIQPNQVLRIP